MQFNCLEAIAYFTSLSRNPKFSWQIANNHILSNYCLALLFISFSHHYINESLAGKKKKMVFLKNVFFPVAEMVQPEFIEQWKDQLR